MYSKIILFFFLCNFSIFLLSAQNSQIPEKHTVFLIGNTHENLKEFQHLQQLKKHLDNLEESYSVLHLGDIIAPTAPLDDDTHPELQKLELILSLADNPKGKLYILPGDMDWSDSGEDGAKRVNKLHKIIAKKASRDVLLIERGDCSGPTILDLTPYIRIIAVNSQWWIHPFKKPIGTSTDCKVLGKTELLEEIDKAIGDTYNKNIVLAMHHPVFSGGIYGGFSTPKMHLFPNGDKIPQPIIGSIRTSFYQNVGTTKYMAHPAYNELKSELEKDSFFRRGLIYASAHEYNLQVVNNNDNYQFVSGSIFKKEPLRRKSGTVYKAKDYGFLTIDFYKNGQVDYGSYLFENSGINQVSTNRLFESPCNENASPDIPKNYFYSPCTSQEKINLPNQTKETTKLVSAGKNYQAKGLKKWFIGNLYRPSWTTEIEVPFLDLENEKGGLTPYTVGGGVQTTSLKFIAKDGRRYTFRSVNKDPVKNVPRAIRETAVISILREVTATEHPYGAIPVAKLLDATDIFHVRPKLFILPDHPKLGVYREKFKGMFGMLEEDPKKSKNGSPAFMDADDVDRSFTMYRKIFNDNDTHVQPRAFAKARVFDMLVGDWDRDPDNWKWALYKEGKKDIFYPIPRDRDQSFSKWDGVIPYLADREWARPNIEHFDYKFKGIRSLNFSARHLDRLLLSSLDGKAWSEIAEELQSEITDSVIDSAIQTFPKEIIPLQGEEVGEKLKSRKTQLVEAVQKYYAALAKYVDVVGSNKHELFLVERLVDGSVSVKMYKKKKKATSLEESDELLYERTFLPKETREIRLYGLDGNDVFYITGKATKSIKVRIIGGNDKDLITDTSEVINSSKATLVYDNTNTQVGKGGSTRLKLSNSPSVNTFNREGFRYNTYIPKPIAFFNADDGLAFQFNIDFTRHGFRSSPYKQRYGFGGKVGSEGTGSISAFTEWSNVLGNWFVGAQGIYADVFPFYNYFGLGNGTLKNNQPPEFFRTNYKGADVQAYARKQFWQQSYFKIGLRFEDYEAVIRENTVLDGESVTGTDPITLAGFTSELDIDFRNGSTYATKGLRIYANHQSGWLLNSGSDYFNISEAFAELYSTYRIVTLAFKFGGAKSTGDRIPFFKYANLGQNTNLRGYLRNRFAGESTMYFNSELRLPFGRLKNPVVPLAIGILGFFDTGRVWHDLSSGDGQLEINANRDAWHNGYGGGFYLVPLDKKYTVSVSAATSEEESLLLMFRLGFGIGR